MVINYDWYITEPLFIHGKTHNENSDIDTL
jgi:hypothetical protein